MARFGQYTDPTYQRPRQERPKASFQHLMQLKRLKPYVHRYLFWLTVALIGQLITRVFDAIVPLFIKVAVDSLVEPVEPNLMWPALGIVGIVLLRFGIFVWSRRIFRRIGISIGYDLRKRLFHHILKHGSNFFYRFNTGDLMSRATGDIGMVRMVVSFGFINVITTIFTFVIGLAFMFTLAPSLALLALLPLPFIGVTAVKMSKRLFPMVRDNREAMADVTSFVQENFNGIRTIQALGQESGEKERFREISDRYASLVFRASKYRALMNLVMPFISAASPFIILGYGGYLVLSDEITLGTFTAFFAYMTMVVGPISSIGGWLQMFTSAAAGTQRLYDVLDTAPEVQDVPSADEPQIAKGNILFRDFSHHFPDSTSPALNDINLEIQSGETIAFIGRIGSGKSTLLRSLVRFTEPAHGTLLIDGRDIHDYPLKNLREQIALIPQDPFLFSALINENITYDQPARSDEPIWSASEAAQIAQSIRDFPKQMKTVVGERGVTLSGGQQQRTTLARGLIRNATVLAMDDCFSSVDTETEELILAGLKRARVNKTTLIVSHRVSTARHADRIFVLDNGHIIENGTHEELISADGFYADLEVVQSNQDKDRRRRDRLLRDLEYDPLEAAK